MRTLTYLKQFTAVAVIALLGLQTGRAGNIYSGTTTVTTAGTRVRLSQTPINALSMAIQVRNGNTGSIYIGGDNISSTNGLRLGPCTSASDTCVSVAFPIASGTGPYNLFNIWIDASVSGEGVTYTYVQ